jgi:hypothetical protein
MVLILPLYGKRKPQALLEGAKEHVLFVVFG